MKKIPTLFKRIFENHKVVGVINEITPGCEEALKKGVATVKFDGACCAIIDGVFYKRYDAKNGKKPPEGAIPCCDPDPVTGHWPHWIKVGDGPEDRWFREAFNNTYVSYRGVNRTFEAIGPHFQGNPHGLEKDTLIPHGMAVEHVGRDFDSIRNWLETHNEEGLVFWHEGEPVCKIKRSDFGLKWPA